MFLLQFDYQSECHCSKTSPDSANLEYRLITSQNATAPKQGESKTQVAIIDVSDGDREHPSVQLVADGVFMDTTLEAVR